MVEVKEPNIETSEKPLDRLQEARELVERQEKANKEAKELLEMQKKMQEELILSGRTSAQTVQQKPKEETPAEYKERILRGGL